MRLNNTLILELNPSHWLLLPSAKKIDSVQDQMTVLIFSFLCLQLVLALCPAQSYNLDFGVSLRFGLGGK